MIPEPIPRRSPEVISPSGYITKLDNDGQRRLYDSTEQEVLLSTMTVENRRRFYQARFDEIKQRVEATLGDGVRLVHTPEHIHIFIASNTSDIPDGGLEYEFVFPDDTSEVDIKYVYNNHSPDNRSPIKKQPLVGVTSLSLAYLLMNTPRIRKIHAMLSETNATALKTPSDHSGKYASIANVPLYKSEAALGFGKIIEVAGGNISTEFF